MMNHRMSSDNIYCSLRYKTLLTIKVLYKSYLGRFGVRKQDILKYMKKHFPVDGDIESQVDSIIKEAVEKKFIVTKNHKIFPLVPAAAVYKIKPIVCDAGVSEIDRIQNLFDCLPVIEELDRKSKRLLKESCEPLVKIPKRKKPFRSVILRKINR